jgi:bacteriochlorophyll 4-vinyl reductase
MVDAGIGRVLIASLHQGIADIAPTRLPFYESWLTPPGLVGARFGLAPLNAALSFLRLEGQPSYDQVMRRAGRYSADWTLSELPPWRRSLVRRCPASLRTRLALGLSRKLVAETFHGSRAKVKVRRGIGVVDIRASIFCDVREPSATPLCGYYTAAVERFLEQCGLDAAVAVQQCRAAGGPVCTLAVTVSGAREPFRGETITGDTETEAA